MEEPGRLIAQPVPGGIRVLLKCVAVARVSVDGFEREEVAEPDSEEERRLAPAGCSVEIGERGIRERLGALQRALVAGQPVQEDVRPDCGALVVAPMSLVARAVERYVIPEQPIGREHAGCHPTQHSLRPGELGWIVCARVQLEPE